MGLPFPAAANIYAGEDETCSRCGTPKAVHRWVCGGCGKELAWGDTTSFGLHGFKDHPWGRHHASAPFLICPHEVARREREGVWDRSTYTEESCGARSAEEQEEAPPYEERGRAGLPRNVEVAWALFGNPAEKTKLAAQRKYRELAKKYHPDVNPAKDAGERLAVANRAWQVLRDHYGW